MALRLHGTVAARTALRCRSLAFLASSPLSTQVSRTSMMTSTGIPDSAQYVIIGGGIIGSSIAYHLAKNGCKDVILFERDRLTSGTTWHAAGLMVTFGSLSETSTEIRKYSRALYKSLEAETGQSTGLQQVGFIELAADSDRLEEYRRIASFNRKCGVDVQEISPREVQQLFPLAQVDDILAGFYVADDGRVNPVDVTMALAKGARMHGVKILEGVSALGTIEKNGFVTGVKVQTDQGIHTIKAEKVVNCAGMWARQLGAMSGVCIPNQAAEHYYLITDAIPEVDPRWPVIEDPAAHCYIRPEGGGLMVGLFEPKAAAWNVKSIPTDFSFGEIQPDWERMSPFLETAMGRVPITLKTGAKTFFCGPESFTPDLGPIVGEAPELRNYFVCAGLNSIGILSGGGMGRLVAHWMMYGRADMDITRMNIDRLHPFQSTPEYRAARVVESLGMVYKCHYPYKTPATARGAKRSPLHDRLMANGAYFKDVSGWEGADWYAPKGVDPEKLALRLCWGRHDWFPLWAAEHAACRSGVVLIDMSFMSKFIVQGQHAGKFLNYLSTANVDDRCDTIIYTQWLNDDGKMEADLTVTKLSNNSFLVIATDTMHRHVETWMKHHIGDHDVDCDIKYTDVTVTDVTGGIAQINLQGPKSRQLLQMLTSVDMSDSSFPFRASREIDIGFAKVRCSRITYVGELGYELFIPVEQAVHVYDRIIQADKEGDVGLKHAGLKALGSLRLEKGYRDYGHDMDNTDTLLEVGLGFTADFDKRSFIGKKAVIDQKNNESHLHKRLLQVRCSDPSVLMFHGEVVWRNGVIVGDVRIASFGHTLNGAVGLTMIESVDRATINKAFMDDARWEVEVAGKKYPATVSMRPMYDPDNLRIKC